MLATQIEVSDGTLGIINVGIQFFEQDDISVSLDQSDLPLVLGVDYVWSASTTVTFLDSLSVPGGLVPAGVEVIIRRDTKNDAMYNILDGGAPFSRLTLDENYKQLLYLTQEFSEGLGLDGLRNSLNMNGYKVVNLGLPTNPQDAANKQYVDAQDAVVQSYMDTLNTRNLRCPEPVAILPSAISRANRTLGFDGFGNPIAITPATGSAEELALVLADPSAPDKGATLLGRAVVAVSSVAALLLQPQRTDLIYLVSSYYEGAGVGGGHWAWVAGSVAVDDYGSVLAVPGVVTGRFIRVRTSRDYSAYEYGVRAENLGTDNRLRLVALYKRLHGSSNTVHLIDEDYNVDASRPIIVPADTHTVGGRGTLIPVLESPLLPATTAANPDGTFKVYGGVFGGGDPVTGNRYSETNFIYRGRNTWTGVKIRNANGLTAASGYSLHGMITHGGVNVYVDCEVDDMPNTGIVTTMYREAHYIRTKCRRNGLLGGGGARNGISNTSTYSFPGTVFPEDDRTTKLTVIYGSYMYSYEEGIQFANVPFVWIEGPDCRFNLDRAIEGDTAYAQLSQNRPNDQIHIYGADCRGVPGSTNYSVSLNDGFNKDVYMGGCRFGGGRQTEVSANCSALGSFTFTSRNKFDLTNVGLLNGCHALYVNAGLIDLSAGFAIRGAHDRSTLNASMLSANNDIASGDVLLADVDSDVKFLYAASAKLTTTFKSSSVNCPTARSFAILTLTANTPLIEINDSGGLLNQDAATDQGLVRLLGLDTFTLTTLKLRGNMNPVNAATRYPVAVSASAVAGRITNLYSSGNYWKGYSFGGGPERITALAGLAFKTSALDLPVLA